MRDYHSVHLWMNVWRRMCASLVTFEFDLMNGNESNDVTKEQDSIEVFAHICLSSSALIRCHRRSLSVVISLPRAQCSVGPRSTFSSNFGQLEQFVLIGIVMRVFWAYPCQYRNFYARITLSSKQSQLMIVLTAALQWNYIVPNVAIIWLLCWYQADSGHTPITSDGSFNCVEEYVRLTMRWSHADYQMRHWNNARPTHIAKEPSADKIRKEWNTSAFHAK